MTIFLEEWKSDGEIFEPEDFKDKSLGTNVFDKLEEIEFDDVKVFRKKTHSTEQELKIYWN